MKLLNFFIKKKAVIIVLIVLIVLLTLSLKSYIACGCGGCGGVKPIYGFTVNPNKIISNDKRLKNSEQCKLMGCGICVRYFYFRFTE